MTAKKIIITGGATRIGAAIANSLANYETAITIHYNKSKNNALKLKKELENGIKDLTKQEKIIREEEKKIIQQKKILSPEEYKKKVTELRKKVSDLQKKRSKLLNTVAKQRSKARSELLRNLNPVVKEYMVEKNIRMVLDKKGVILADEKLDITNDIITKLNAKIKTLKLD